ISVDRTRGPNARQAVVVSAPTRLGYPVFQVGQYRSFRSINFTYFVDRIDPQRLLFSCLYL
ncbi:MAG: hypothetical protein WAW74_06635, partial [Trichococcus flocculiformis]